jgi:hypothetical protein
MRNKTITLLAAFAVFVTISALWLTNRAVTPKTPTWDDVVAEAKVGGYKLITTEELASRYQKEKSVLLLVDTRQDWEYRTGHIEGAVFFPMEPTAWSRWKNKDALATLLGPDKSRTIVFY